MHQHSGDKEAKSARPRQLYSFVSRNRKPAGGGFQADSARCKRENIEVFVSRPSVYIETSHHSNIRSQDVPFYR